MAGSLSFRVHRQLLKVGHAQYRQLNLELEGYFYKKWEEIQKLSVSSTSCPSLQAFHHAGPRDDT
jgi:hypothetical protein